MWKRKSWHECAEELKEYSDRFVILHWHQERRPWSKPTTRRTDELMNEMQQVSIDALELLKSLAANIRTDQDYGLTDYGGNVGLLKTTNISENEHLKYKQEYRLFKHDDLVKQGHYQNLSLRDGLNKVIHADPSRSDYYVAPRYKGENAEHALLLYSTKGVEWFAVLSLLRLIEVIKELPDKQLD